jgi:hypothetical protein
MIPPGFLKMLSAILLITACDQPKTPNDTSTPIEVPEDNISKILADCWGEQKAPDPYPNQLTQGTELERYTLKNTDALCNDGSPAALYIRPYSNPDFKNIWSIHVQGGGGCSSWEECAGRWCGSGYYDASKMSSTYAPDQIGGFGIYDSDPLNLLSEANQIFFYYCSSDSWAGQGTVSYTPEDSQYQPYTLFSRGHLILTSAIDELEIGVHSDLQTELPPLSEASMVVFSGTSAGSNGVQDHADWLNERLSPNGTTVFAIFDAANNPDTAYLSEDLQAEADTLFSDYWDNNRQPAILPLGLMLPAWNTGAVPARNISVVWAILFAPTILQPPIFYARIFGI